MDNSLPHSYHAPHRENEIGSSSLIVLKWLPQQDGFNGPDGGENRPKDKGKGLSPAERRKAQNRLHQRAWRKRKATSRAQLRLIPPSATDSDSSSLGTVTSVERDARFSPTPSRPVTGSAPSKQQEIDLSSIFDSAAGLSKISPSKRAHTVPLCHPGPTSASQTISQFRSWAQKIASPRADMLLVLVKINVFRALISNSLTLGFIPEHDMDDNAISPFCTSPNHLPVRSILSLPVALRPTELQCSVRHHPWIDLLPVPRMRENILKAGDGFDEMELCGDLVGLFSSGNYITGLIVWGEPWDVKGWEVTEEFLKVWGWIVKGCWEIFEATNQWRARRGQNHCVLMVYDVAPGAIMIYITTIGLAGI